MKSVAKAVKEVLTGCPADFDYLVSSIGCCAGKEACWLPRKTILAVEN